MYRETAAVYRKTRAQSRRLNNGLPRTLPPCLDNRKRERPAHHKMPELYKDKDVVLR